MKLPYTALYGWFSISTNLRKPLRHGAVAVLNHDATSHGNGDGADNDGTVLKISVAPRAFELYWPENVIT